MNGTLDLLKGEKPNSGKVYGWGLIEPTPERGERIVTPEQLSNGWYMRLGTVVFRTSYRIISRLESGNYLVEDPKQVGGFGEYPMAEPEEKTC